jgi:hypothetical protein
VNLADLPWLPRVVPAADELLREEGFVDGADEGEGGEGAAAAVPGAGGVRQEGR